MGLLKSPIGSISGKVGNLRFTASGAETIVASQPSSYNDAETPSQVTQRTKMTGCVELSKLFLGVVSLTLAGFAKRVSGYNRFVSLNIDAIPDNGDIRDTNWNVLTVSEGAVLSPNGAVSAVSNNGGDLDFTYAPNVNGTNGLATDKLMFVAVNGGGVVVSSGYTGFTRNAAAGAKSVDTAVVRNVGFNQVYFYFQSADGRNFSDSIGFFNI
jgi:hypothetical protein